MLSLVLGYTGYLRYQEGKENFKQYATATVAVATLELTTILITLNFAQ